ncbi:MAG: NADH-quinone oxidoreductase subunit L [Bdellovibrionota bacterium]
MEIIQANLGIIALAPLLGSFLAFVVGKEFKQSAGVIATSASAIAFLWVLKLFFGLEAGQVFEQKLFSWFSSGTLTVDFALRFDHLTAVMALVVTGIGTLIHLYSIGYMSHDESPHRFFSYLNLFMFSMLLLVLGGNLLVLFVGWEGVGLCSYLLIGFWFKNLDYAAAGKKAFVVNRIGDAGFLIGIFLLFWNYGTVDFAALQIAIAENPGLSAVLTTATLCLFVGATGKSAQIPLFVWLPDAMAGPTPVSALIHAATMVTAGVYMLARLHFAFVLAPYTLAIIAVIAVLTAFVAATTALAQYDIKKVLAYSTVSQLGFMFMAAAAGAFWAAIFHVVTHAFFKACLFLGAGSVIHGCHHEQDMRKMGGLSKLMPITFVTYLISTLAIAGIFPLAGYYSKHAVVAALGSDANPYLNQIHGVMMILVSVSAFLTAFYMTRSLVMTFFGKYRGEHHPHESPWSMTLPLIVLAFLAVIGGIWLEGSLPHYLGNVLPHAAEHPHESILASIKHSWIGILGVGLALLVYTKFTSIADLFAAIFKPLFKLFSGKWYFDEIYGSAIVRPLEGAARLLWKKIDQGVIDGTVNGSASIVDLKGEIIRRTQTGQIRQYAFFMFFATVAIIGFCLLM